jgi:hypothetical protein
MQAKKIPQIDAGFFNQGSITGQSGHWQNLRGERHFIVKGDSLSRALLS